MEAVETLKSRGDQDAQGLLEEVAAKADNVELKAAAQAALDSIKTRLALWNMAQNIWYGVSASSVLLLAAIGLAITFGVMGVINMAHGEMVMLGAYTTFVVQSLLPPWLSQWSLADIAAARVCRRRSCWCTHRAIGHPISIRSAVGDAARNMGSFADPAADRAHNIWR